MTEMVVVLKSGHELHASMSDPQGFFRDIGKLLERGSIHNFLQCGDVFLNVNEIAAVHPKPKAKL
jgi:hypothetical protein